MFYLSFAACRHHAKRPLIQGRGYFNYKDAILIVADTQVRYPNVHLSSSKSSRYFFSKCELSSNEFVHLPHSNGSVKYNSKFKIWVVPATSFEEKFSAASLRTQIFFSYPKLSPYESENDFFRTNIRQSLESRLESELDRDSKLEILGMKVISLLAICLYDEYLDAIRKWNYENPVNFVSSKAPCLNLPLDRDQFVSKQTYAAIGTLDLQHGSAILGEYLEKPFVPKDKNIDQCGYVFNLGVLDAFRRRGIAQALMKVASTVAISLQLQTLYVHVDEENEAAISLYTNLGYSFFVDSFSESQRLLLNMDLS